MTALLDDAGHYYHRRPSLHDDDVALAQAAMAKTNHHGCLFLIVKTNPSPSMLAAAGPIRSGPCPKNAQREQNPTQNPTALLDARCLLPSVAHPLISTARQNDARSARAKNGACAAAPTPPAAPTIISRYTNKTLQKTCSHKTRLGGGGENKVLRPTHKEASGVYPSHGGGGSRIVCLLAELSWRCCH